jgi:hypothetical protein
MTRNTAITTLIAAGLVSLAGCGSSNTGNPQPAPSATSSKVDTAVAIAREMEANPEQAEQVLQKRGMTEQQFEDLMYEIASDPALSDQYSKKLGR